MMDLPHVDPNQLGEDAGLFLVALWRLMDGDHRRPVDEARRRGVRYRTNYRAADTAALRAHLRAELDRLQSGGMTQVMATSRLGVHTRRVDVLQAALEGLGG
jgi:hypothetical protein